LSTSSAVSSSSFAHRLSSHISSPHSSSSSHEPDAKRAHNKIIESQEESLSHEENLSPLTEKNSITCYITVPVVFYPTMHKWNKKLVDILAKPSKSLRKVHQFANAEVIQYHSTRNIDTTMCYSLLEYTSFINKQLLLDGKVKQPIEKLLTTQKKSHGKQSEKVAIVLPTVLQANTCSIVTHVALQIIATNHFIMIRLLDLLDQYSYQTMIELDWPVTSPYPSSSLTCELLSSWSSS